MSKAKTPATPKKNLKYTLVAYIAIVSGIFLFMLAAMLIVQSRGPLMPQLNQKRIILVGCMTGVAFLCLLGARVLFTRGVAIAKDSLKSLSDRLTLHRNALIKYLIICEMPVMMGIILFMLTGDFIFEVFAAVFIGFMLTMLPTKKRVAELLQLDWQQQGELK